MMNMTAQIPPRAKRVAELGSLRERAGEAFLRIQPNAEYWGITDDVEVIAAAVLHDVVEDTDATVAEVEELFGHRVAQLVAGESEDKREGLPPSETWRIRKEESLAYLRDADDPGVRMVCLGDKLSNIRAIQRDHGELGDMLWQRFNQKDPAEHAWYYRSIVDLLEGELGETEAWRELAERVEAVFAV